MLTLRELRVKRDWTQDELAGFAGVGPQTVWRAEAGRAINKKTARALCKALEVSLEDVSGLNLYSAVQAHNKGVLR